MDSLKEKFIENHLRTYIFGAIFKETNIIIREYLLS